MFEPKADRDISKLDQVFKKKVVYFLNEVNKMGVFVTEAYRTKERQNYLLKKGLSKVPTSQHQLGMAIDIAFEGELYPKDMKIWREVADIANKYSIDWGYDLWKWDMPHFQDNGKPFIEPKEFTMTKQQQDAIDNVIYSLKCLYHLGDDDMKKFANKKADECRKLKGVS